MSDKPIGLGTLSTIRDWVKGLIPTKTSDLTNDSGYITGYTETDPTVPSWAKAASKPTYTASEVGADASGTAVSAVSSHNSDATAHGDIRNAIPTNVSDLTNDAGYTSNIGTITEIIMNDSSVGTSGAVDLGTVITSHQDISGKLDKTGGTIYGNLRISGTLAQGGSSVTASGTNSHAEGSGTIASAAGAHAEGHGTLANSAYQHVSGRYNISDANDIYAEIVGNGTINANRSNARTLDWNGNATYAGKVTVGAAPTANMDVATKLYVDTAVSGAGDMSTSVYDTDSDGVVDEAEAVSNVSGTGGIEFGLDADGKGQYRAVGAATWIPFLTGGDAFESLNTDGALVFGSEQADEFANNRSKTYTLTGLEAGNEYLFIPIQVVATGTPHMWIGGQDGYTQTFNGATVLETKTNNVLTFQRVSVTSNNPTMTIQNSSGYKNRFITFVFQL